MSLALLAKDNFLNLELNWRLEAIYERVLRQQFRCLTSREKCPHELNPMPEISSIDSVGRVLSLNPTHDHPLAVATTVPDLRKDASCGRSARE